MKKWKNILSLCITLAAFTACSEEDYKVYDTTQTDNIFFSYFNEKNQADSIISYNFGFDIANEHIVEIPVTLMGMPSEKDRTIGLKAVSDSTEMAEGTHYIIDRALLRAGRIDDTIRVKLLRPDDEKFRTEALRLYLEIEPTSDLSITGQKTFTIMGYECQVDLHGGMTMRNCRSILLRMPSYSSSISTIWLQRLTKMCLMKSSTGMEIISSMQSSCKGLSLCIGTLLRNMSSFLYTTTLRTQSTGRMELLE